MKKRTQLSLVMTSVALAVGAASAQAAELEITVTNATKGIYFTPLIVAAHGSDLHMFKVGEFATTELEAMAEGGDISGLSTVIGNAGGTVVENPAGGILNPGAVTTFTLDSGDHGYLSLSAMLLPTNDGFVGLDSWKIPTEAGTYKATLNSYDAGTEANDELASSIPNPPFITFGSGGTGVETAVSNDKVHIHPGNLGDSAPAGGKSDLDSSHHRWLNPVATITIVVK
ncbi:spondin domain-containing protein [Vibrio parahaemolyticus]|uniref:spondin domain-containing protein n=1 Tax=Vibrio parahaemolyticus TaxID=670 RepID=UPI0004D6274F|nr:spondin domain-containing protein [Vibrio parahaemolyticus]EJG0618700.1 spondin domain-containing protein [Vibrio parahaemolyticus]EJG0636922.1 spondin domain-containing protein [Vibrio parahaemolyticus]EJG0683404.1 spondin domain-containing protein [Vibrio parahaemolyticus]EJG0698483.1 spondin domain-containing protein [Vibrio parahaemolyticus]EJG0729899.1 spondin domain-containing protein [Vibrio parahaemolyticus]